MMIKIVQMMSHLGALYMVDELGRLFRYYPESNFFSLLAEGIPK